MRALFGEKATRVGDKSDDWHPSFFGIYVPVVSLEQLVDDIVFVASFVASENSPPRAPPAS